jgi:hypothetical protein
MVGQVCVSLLDHFVALFAIAMGCRGACIHYWTA